MHASPAFLNGVGNNRRTGAARGDSAKLKVLNILLFGTQSVSEAGMPAKRALERARRDKREGKAPTTQAGEFIREEIHHIREGKHGARSAKQAIAIGLSQARRAGIDLPPPKAGAASGRARKSAAAASARGHGIAPPRPASARRARASAQALKRESRSAATHGSLAKQARAAAKRRTRNERSASAKRAAKTKRRLRRAG